MQIDTKLPSYEESIYVNPFQNEKLGLLPSHFEKTLLVEFIEDAQLGHNESEPTNALPEQLNNRLERVSVYIQQMIDTAKASLITVTMEAMDDDKSSSPNDNVSYHRQRQTNRKTSIGRLRSSQSNLARTIDQLNASIIQSIIGATASPPPDTKQQMNNDSEGEDSKTTIVHHHHYHHHHYHHHHYSDRRRSMHQRTSPLAKQQQSSPPPPSAKFPISFWVNVLTQITLVFCICRCILSWTKLTSSLMGATWLVGLLWIKKRLRHASKLLSILAPSSLCSSLKSSLVTRIYLISLTLFGQH